MRVVYGINNLVQNLTKVHLISANHVNHLGKTVFQFAMIAAPCCIRKSIKGWYNKA